MVSLQERQIDISPFMNQDVETISNGLDKAFQKLRNVKDPTDYSLVIGDDYSGRIPATITERALNNLGGKSEVHAVFYKPHFRLNPGDHMSKTEVDIAAGVQAERLLTQLESENVMNIERALFVTESVYTGITTVLMAKAFRKLGINFDVLSFFCPKEKDVIMEDFLKPYDARFFAGRIGYSEPNIDYRKFLSMNIEKDITLASKNAISVLRNDK